MRFTFRRWWPLRDHLTEDNHVELLGAASRKNKGELLALLAARFPKPDVPSTIRKLPARKDSTKAAEQSALPLEGSAQHAATGASESLTAAAPAPAGRGGVEPLSPARYRVQFTADERLKHKLDRVTELLRHSNPTGDLAAIVERAVDLLLADVEKKRLAKTEHPRLSRKGASDKRSRAAVTRAAKRETYARDGERCSFVSADGKRCGERGFLELDHIVPRALRGTGDSGNLRVACAAHNRWFAEQIFGRERVDAAINFRRRKRDGTVPNAQAGADVTTRSGLPAAAKQPTERTAADNDETYRKLLSGLDRPWFSAEAGAHGARFNPGRLEQRCLGQELRAHVTRHVGQKRYFGAQLCQLVDLVESSRVAANGTSDAELSLLEGEIPEEAKRKLPGQQALGQTYVSLLQPTSMPAARPRCVR